MKLTKLIKSKPTAPSQTDTPNLAKSKIISASFQKKFKFSKKIKLVLSLIVIIILISIVTVLIIYRTNNSNTAICNNQMVTNAISSFKDNNTTLQRSIAQQIQNTSGYKYSPNCMYILSVYQIEIANGVSAQNDINLLVSLLNKGNKLDFRLTNYISIKSLKNDVNSLNFRLKQNMNNITNISH